MVLENRCFHREESTIARVAEMTDSSTGSDFSFVHVGGGSHVVGGNGAAVCDRVRALRATRIHYVEDTDLVQTVICDLDSCTTATALPIEEVREEQLELCNLDVPAVSGAPVVGNELSAVAEQEQ